MKISPGVAALIAFVLAFLAAPAGAAELCRLHTSLSSSDVSRSCLEPKQGGQAKSVDTYQVVVQPTTLTGKATSQAPATVPAFAFDTEVAHTSGNLFEVYDGGVLKYAIDYSGTVTVGAGGATTASNGLTESGGDVKLGGTLAADTTVATAGHAFYTGQGNYYNFGSLYTAGGGLFVDQSSGFAGFGETTVVGVNNREYTQISAVSGQAVMLARKLNDDATNTPQYDGSVSVYNPSYSGGVGQYMIDAKGIGPTKTGELWLTITEPTEARWSTSGEWTFADYLSTRDNTGTSTPVNFLYTDPSGNMKAGALNSSVTRTALGLADSATTTIATLFTGPVLVDGGTKPSCTSGIRGKIWYDAGDAGVADTVEICAHKSDNSYAWIAMATIP